MIGFAVAAGMTPLVIRGAERFGVLDVPIGEKIHKRTTPLLGGVAVYVAFGCAVLISLPLSKAIVGLLVGGLAAVAVGIADEKVTLPPLIHLLGQLAVAAVTIVAGVGTIRSVSIPSGALTSPGLELPAIVGLGLTLFWLVGMMNTVNFLDGLDGLATGVVALAALLLAIWASEPQRFYLPPTSSKQDLILPLALVGALLGFLLYNWHPARIFLGDSGSMLLGLLLGALSIIGPAKLATALLILLIPVLDVAWAIVRRRIRGRSFLAGDKQHVYHRLLELGMSYTAVVLLFYVLCIALGILDLALLKIYKLIAFAILVTVFGSGFVLLELRTAKAGAAASSAYAPLEAPTLERSEESPSSPV